MELAAGPEKVDLGKALVSCIVGRIQILWVWVDYPVYEE